MIKLDDCFVRYIASSSRKQALFLHLGFNGLAKDMDISFVDSKHGVPDVLVIDENTLLEKPDPHSQIASLKEKYPHTPIILLTKKYKYPETKINEQDLTQISRYMQAGVDNVLPWSRSGDNPHTLTRNILQEYERVKRLGWRKDKTSERLYLAGMELIPDRHEVRVGPVIINNFNRLTMGLLCYFAKSSRVLHDHDSISAGVRHVMQDPNCLVQQPRTVMKRLKKDLKTSGCPEVFENGHKNHGLSAYTLKR